MRYSRNDDHKHLHMNHSWKHMSKELQTPKYTRSHAYASMGAYESITNSYIWMSHENKSLTTSKHVRIHEATRTHWMCYGLLHLNQSPPLTCEWVTNSTQTMHKQVCAYRRVTDSYIWMSHEYMRVTKPRTSIVTNSIYVNIHKPMSMQVWAHEYASMGASDRKRKKY